MSTSVFYFQAAKRLLSQWLTISILNIIYVFLILKLKRCKTCPLDRMGRSETERDTWHCLVLLSKQLQTLVSGPEASQQVQQGYYVSLVSVTAGLNTVTDGKRNPGRRRARRVHSMSRQLQTGGGRDGSIVCPDSSRQGVGR